MSKHQPKRVVQHAMNENGEFVEQTPEERKEADAKTTATNIIWYVFGIVAFLLGMRFALKALGANSANGFVEFIYAVSGVLSAPFDTVFGVTTSEAGETTSVFEPSILVAIAVYALIAWALTKAFTLNEN